MTAMTRTLARAVLIAGLALPATALLPATAPFSISKAYAADPTTVAQFQSVLAAYGKWGTHDKYGAIWVPTVTPPGWHPYPACQWVYTKQGWYFNDNTPWGSIVHHYGRWSHDDQVGWFWVPDQEWSPGWVAWRQSDQWVGWAPLPPQQDMQIVNTPAFDNDKLWIFMAADKFKSGCSDGSGQVVGGDTGGDGAFYAAYDGTQPTTWFGLAPGNLVNIDIDQHWTINNIIKLIKVDIDINVIDINFCPPSTKPPGNNPPNNNPPNNNPPNNPPGTTNNTTPNNPPAIGVLPAGPVTHINFPPNGSTLPTIQLTPVMPQGGRNGRHGSDNGSNGNGNNGNTFVAKTVGVVSNTGSKLSPVGVISKKPNLSLAPATSRSLSVSNPSTVRNATMIAAPRSARRSFVR